MDEPNQSRSAWWKVATLAALSVVAVLLAANLYLMGVLGSHLGQLNYRMHELEMQVNDLREELRSGGDVSN